MHVAINKLRLVLRNILPFCNLIGSARIPAETKGQPKKVNVSNQTPLAREDRWVWSGDETSEKAGIHIYHVITIATGPPPFQTGLIELFPYV